MLLIYFTIYFIFFQVDTIPCICCKRYTVYKKFTRKSEVQVGQWERTHTEGNLTDVIENRKL